MMKPWVLQKPYHTNWARMALLVVTSGVFFVGCSGLEPPLFVLETIWLCSTARSLEVVRSKSSQDSSGHEEGQP